ncbi:MAG TPA: hypothetical protein DDW42_09305 [Desulfobacteraceae bacterium]|nr:hypothetical protein [Desulfobacteraceae bacterium]
MIFFIIKTSEMFTHGTADQVVRAIFLHIAIALNHRATSCYFFRQLFEPFSKRSISKSALICSRSIKMTRHPDV